MEKIAIYKELKQNHRNVQPNAPKDMFSALGKNGQFINVIPSQNMVWIRMGENPDSAEVPFLFNDDIWKYINDLSCVSSSTDPFESINHKFKIYPNPTIDHLEVKRMDGESKITRCEIRDQLGRLLFEEDHNGGAFQINTEPLNKGMYFLVLFSDNKTYSYKFIKA
ncbi:MAG: T9SS type A sorting domain-containing protein [Saprospiraceae bacterium]|nr:T9SS type A sorting domain-containing protein [Saprospiraceae bacterium]